MQAVAFRWVCVGFVACFSCFVFMSEAADAQSSEDMKARIQYIDAELKKIQARIDSGLDPKLFEKFKNDFETEKSQLQQKLSQAQSTPKARPKPKPKPKPVPTRPPQPTQKLSSNAAFKPDVGLGDGSQATLMKLLAEQRQRKLDLLQKNGSARELRQVDVNITYLEVALAKLPNAHAVEKATAGSPQRFTYRGHFQLRTESGENLKGVQGTRQTEQTFFRFRTYFQFNPSQALTFNLTPQATKGFGAAIADGETVNTTSGSTNHTEVSFFEANVNYQPIAPVGIKIGRQELAYGDHVVIGSLPWANTGRSFDAAKVRWSYAWGWSDFVFSKISDNATARDSGDDVDLGIAYTSMKFGAIVKALDLYFIHQDDDRAEGIELNMFGLRALVDWQNLFARTENAIQRGNEDDLEDAYHYNVELGGRIGKFSVSAEYALAGPDYRQLYPTAHKFLGFADVLGRRNVEHYALHLKGGILSWLSARADYHVFNRVETDKPAYALNGATPIGSEGDAEDIGSEIDLVLNFKSSDAIKLQLGGALFTPGDYMVDQDEQGRDEDVVFLYAQVNAGF